MNQGALTAALGQVTVCWENGQTVYYSESVVSVFSRIPALPDAVHHACWVEWDQNQHDNRWNIAHR